jgi:uncharacterized BrkB/YihY/UPF0761 family membrane protein
VRQVRPIRLEQIRNLTVADIPKPEELVPDLLRYAWLGVLALALVAWALFIAVRPATPRDLTTVSGTVTGLAPIPGHRVTHQRVTLLDASKTERIAYIANGPGEPQFLEAQSLKIGDRIDATVTSFAFVTELRREGRVILRDETARAHHMWRTFLPGLIATILTLTALVLGVLTRSWHHLKPHIKPITV